MKNSYNSRFAQSAALASVSMATIALLASVPAMAQTAPAPAADEATTGEIIVTAQRRSENVMKVPVSVTVIGADALAKNGVTDLASVTRLAPSLQAGQDNQFSIRGVGTATFANTIESSVTQMVDDVVLGSRYFASNSFADVERVEVLNGPQGLLFGKNASAGLVNITSTAPKLGQNTIAADSELTSRYRSGKDGFGALVRATSNVALGEHTALRINGLYNHQDGVIRYVQTGPGRADNDIEQYAIRAKLLSELTPDLKLYLIGDYAKTKGVSGTFSTVYRSLGTGSYYNSILANAGVTPSDRNMDVAVNAPFWRDLETGGAQGKLTYSLANGWEISNIAAWKTYKLDAQFDSDFTPVNFFDYNGGVSKFNQVSNELRLTLPADDRLSGQVGLFYYHAAENFAGGRGGNNGLPGFLLPNFPFCVGATTLGAPPAACPASNTTFLGQDFVGRVATESVAAFGQFTFRVTDQLKLIAGGRYTHDKATLDLTENTGRYFVTLGVPNNHYTGETTANNFSWKLGVDFQPTPDTLIYGFYGRGYKGPGFSNAAPAPSVSLAVKPEISKGGEIGIKQQLFDRKVSLSLAAFYTRFENLQVTAFDQNLRTATLGNAGKATTQGIDATATVRAATGLTLSASATLLDAKYNSYPGRQCYPTQPDPSCAINGTFDASGRQIPLAAKFTSVISANYERPLSSSLTLVSDLSFYHRSPLLVNYAPGTVIPSWNTIGASLGLKGANWNASLFCKNCFNEMRPLSIEVEAGDGLSGPGHTPTLTYLQRWNFDSIRTIGLRFGVNF